MELKTLIVDDQVLVRAGFRKLLEAEPGIEVVGEASDGREAIDQARRLHPDVILMDIRMPEMDGLAATKQIASELPDCNVLILTTYDLDEYVFEALKVGASGFLLKDSPPEQLLAGVRSVARGDALLAPSITRRLIEEFAERPQVDDEYASRISSLTQRETEVLKLIAQGLSNAEIAGALFLGEATVKSHVTNILMKLQVRDRVQAVVAAYESGLVKPGAAGGTTGP